MIKFIFIFVQFVHVVKRYLEQFGEVESIYTCANKAGRHTFGFVQFKSSNAAKLVLSSTKHRYSGKYFFNVRVAYDGMQPDFEEFKPPQQDSPRHILHALNDDCFRVIFKAFDVVDLSSAAEVCVRFREHAIIAFKSEYKQSLDADYGSEFMQHPDQFEVCLRNFGKEIHSLNINCDILRIKSINILKMINNHMPALKHLKLHNFYVSDKVQCVHPLFAKLQTLSLNDCHFAFGAEQLLVPCTQLKQLCIDGTDWDNNCIGRSFPQLEEFQLSACETIDGKEFKTFIECNSALKKLSVRDNDELESSSVVQWIAGLKNLVELEIDVDVRKHLSKFVKCSLHLSELQSLQKLTLNNNCHNVTPLLTKLAEKAVPLTYFALKHGDIDSKGIQKMAELQKLNTIVLEDIDDLKDDHMVELAKGLPQLRAVHLLGSTAENITTNGLRTMLKNTNTLSHLILKEASSIASIDNYDYRAMLKTVQDRPKQMKVSIELSGDGDKLQVSHQLMTANQEWLWIDEQVEDNDTDSFDDYYDSDDYNDYFDSDSYGDYQEDDDDSDDDDDGVMLNR